MDLANVQDIDFDMQFAFPEVIEVKATISASSKNCSRY